MDIDKQSERKGEGEIILDSQPLVSTITSRDNPDGINDRRSAFKIFAEQRRQDIEEAIERRVAMIIRRRSSR